jgi:hypothetical protein
MCYPLWIGGEVKADKAQYITTLDIGVFLNEEIRYPANFNSNFLDCKCFITQVFTAVKKCCEPQQISK